ncbi:MAG: M20/M25/M40 family metallo-hydrolase [Betaproteobacteria bacterium]|nr:M20/M25/M40 family metallo-hydrolase [Betaproteobacteria bacterium]
MPATMSELERRVLGLIDRQELVDLALRLGNIPSPAGEEADIGEFIDDWLRRNGFSPRKIGFAPERFCVAGILPGSGGGLSLAFNSHMDTARQVDDVAKRIRPQVPNEQAWVDAQFIVGAGIVNDKGPMAAWMIAANAIRKAGVKLKGDLILTMVPGEIDQEPVDEFTSSRYLSKEVGARYMITRGVVADYALVAEGTQFNYAWVGAGKACFKITLRGQVMYIPYLPPRGDMVRSPNAIVKSAVVIAALENWACDYERDGMVDTPGGKVVPKANIGAMRSGNPYHISMSTETCHLYLDVRLAPGADPLAIQNSLKEAIAATGVEAKLEMYTYRKAQLAEGIDDLVEAIGQTHLALGCSPPAMADPVYSSMWRDHIAFIEAGIPALTYGPGGASGGSGERPGMLIDDLERAARCYALVALNVCSRVKQPASKKSGAKGG